MVDDYKYVALDSTYMYSKYLDSMEPFFNQISPSIITVLYSQLLRLTFDKANINIIELQHPPHCDSIVMAYGLIIDVNIKNNVCLALNDFYFSIMPELLNQLSKLGLLVNGCLQNFIFIEHDQINNLIILKRVTS